MLMISILNIPLFSSANEYEKFIDAMKPGIERILNLKLKGEEEGEGEEINTIIQNMLDALFRQDYQTFETINTQFLTKFEAKQLPVFYAHCITTILMFEKCTPEILKVILNSDGGTDLIQQTFPIDQHSVIESILVLNKLDLFNIIIEHPKTYKIFISNKKRPDLQDSETPAYNHPYNGCAMDIFHIIINNRFLTNQEKLQYLQTTLLFKEKVGTRLQELESKQNKIDLTNFKQLCSSYEDQKTKIATIMNPSKIPMDSYKTAMSAHKVSKKTKLQSSMLNLRGKRDRDIEQTSKRWGFSLKSM